MGPVMVQAAAHIGAAVGTTNYHAPVANRAAFYRHRMVIRGLVHADRAPTAFNFHFTGPGVAYRHQIGREVLVQFMLLRRP